MIEKLKLNETPVRTTRNYNINNIKLDNINIPENIPDFNSIDIEERENILIDKEKKVVNIAYGVGDIITNLINEKSNNNLNIDIDKEQDGKIKVLFNFNMQNTLLLDNIHIIAHENSNANIIIKYESEKDIEAFHAGMIKVIAKKNANVKITVVNLLNNESNNFISMESELYANSNVDYTIIDFGGKNSITNYYSNLLGENSSNNLDTIYLGNNEQLFDLNYIGELRGKKANINMNIQGALNDYSKKHFKGTIDFKKDCKKAKGDETENCILLSDKAKSLSLPMLLCSEEDVEGNHSSSAGKIDNAQLFYIMSRGFDIKEAMKLIVRARFNNVLKKIQDEELKNEILSEIDNRIR